MTDLDLRMLSDAELRARLARLAADERRVTSELLRHLAEFDRRGLYRKEGYQNLWDYCAQELKFSEAEIKLRTQAARAVAENPTLLGLLQRGETTLSAIGRLAPHLNGERKEQLLEQVKGLNAREVQWLVATEKAEEKIQAAKAAGQAEARLEPSLFDEGPRRPDDAAIRAELFEECDRIIPLSGERARLEAVVSREFVKKLEKAQVLLARRFPKGRVEDVLDEALEHLLDVEDPDRRDRRRQERAAKAGSERLETSKGRRLSKRLRDRVLSRDGGRCVAKEADGNRCPATRFLEVDHTLPLALGGRTIYENLRSLCRRHHGQASIKVFGEERIQAAIEARENGRPPA